MSIIINTDGGPHTLPDHDHFEDVVNALGHDVETVGAFTDDPHQWIDLLAAVGNYLYSLPPAAFADSFELDQLLGAFLLGR